MIPYSIPAEPGCYTVIYELKDGSTESRDVWLWPEQKVQGRPRINGAPVLREDAPLPGTRYSEWKKLRLDMQAVVDIIAGISIRAMEDVLNNEDFDGSARWWLSGSWRGRQWLASDNKPKHFRPAADSSKRGPYKKHKKH